MINFYGVFQLVKVTKETKTSKSKDLLVYFSAASHRSKEQTDFKFFKIIGKNAERFLEFLEKNSSGEYISRKMMIGGYVETYKEKVDVKCSRSVKSLPEKYGILNRSFKVETTETIEVEKDIYVVSHFEFLDNKGSKKGTIREIEGSGDLQFLDIEDDYEDEKLEVAATKEKTSTVNNSDRIYKDTEKALDDIDKFLSNNSLKVNNIQDLIL